jgi:4-hydroxy-2-oxoheptanedioate aldolase
MTGAFSLANGFKAALREGRSQIGLWQVLASPITAEICAGAGYDWLLFDGEHGPNDLRSLLAQLQAVSAYPVHPIARLPSGETALIKQYLDIGFQTLLIPFVENAEQAAALVRAVRYPPEGVRGVAAGIVRASRWGRIPDYLDRASEQVCLLIQIETAAGLANLDAIASVDGIDGVFIGPADLAASLGYRGHAGSVEVVERIEAAIMRLKQLNKPSGILTTDPVFGRACLDLGSAFLAVGTDAGLLTRGSDALLRDFVGGGGKATTAVY